MPALPLHQGFARNVTSTCYRVYIKLRSVIFLEYKACRGKFVPSVFYVPRLQYILPEWFLLPSEKRVRRVVRYLRGTDDRFRRPLYDRLNSRLNYGRPVLLTLTDLSGDPFSTFRLFPSRSKPDTAHGSDCKGTRSHKFLTFQDTHYIQRKNLLDLTKHSLEITKILCKYKMSKITNKKCFSEREICTNESKKHLFLCVL